MRIGLCCEPSEGPAALAAGYDYVEFPAAATEPSETTYLFFPGNVRIYGPGADALARGEAIIRSAAGRGVRLMVLGSGGVRRAPAEMDIEHAEAVFYDLAADLDRFAQTLGLRVAPESLNLEETDVGSVLPDLAQELAARGAPFTADTYHALREEETVEANLAFWRRKLPIAPLHVHLGPLDRSVPKADDPSLRAFAARLAELGYDGRASLECRRDGIPDPQILRDLMAP